MFFFLIGLGFLLYIAYVDWKKSQIPNKLLGLFSLLIIPTVWLFPEIEIAERVVGAVCVSVPMLMIALLIPGAFGGGDIKLMSIIGGMLGWKQTLVSFVVGVLCAGVYALWLRLVKKKTGKTKFPFGPFLCMGIVVGVVAGERIFRWYIG